DSARNAHGHDFVEPTPRDGPWIASQQRREAVLQKRNSALDFRNLRNLVLVLRMRDAHIDVGSGASMILLVRQFPGRLETIAYQGRKLQLLIRRKQLEVRAGHAGDD